MALEPGTSAYVWYRGGDPYYHERIVLGWVEEGEYVVLTPDGDIFIEQLDAANVHLDALRIGTSDGTLPFGLDDRRIYAFAPRPAGEQLANVLREGLAFARAERQARGVAGGVAGAMLREQDYRLRGTQLFR